MSTPFLAVEIGVATFATLRATGRAWAARAWSSRPHPQTPLEVATTLRASDRGYRTRAGDPAGVIAYPPLLQAGVALDRHIPLDPSASAVTVGVGAISLLNPDQRWDDLVSAGNVDGRPVKLLRGLKGYDVVRGLEIDPPYGELAPIFAGVGRPWTLEEAALTVPVQDNTRLLSRSLRLATYRGAGGIQGDAQAQGQPVPWTRGGSPDAPVHQVPLRLVDAARLIYAFTDGAGQLVAYYEGGDGSLHVSDGDAADLWDGATPAPGHYRSCNARGLLQLGSPPAATPMVDCTGHFHTAGGVNVLADVVHALLVEELGVSATLLDEASFAAARVAFPWPVGVHTDGTATTGAALVSLLLGGTGLRIVPQRDGTLGLLQLRAPDPAERVAARWTIAEIVDCKPFSLGSPLDPPAYRWRVGWRRNHITLSGSGVSVGLSAADRQVAADEYQYASSGQRAAHLQTRQPSDPPPLATALLRQADAQVCADRLSALWTPDRRGYALSLPAEIAERVELGAQVHVTYPVGRFRIGGLARVVGEQVRSGDSTVVQVII